MSTNRIYIRKSPSREDDERPEGERTDSSENQEDICRAWCEVNHPKQVVVYEDAETSGAPKKGALSLSGLTRDRKGLDKLLNDIEPGDIMVAYSLDRMARHITLGMLVAEALDMTGARLAFADEGYVDIKSAVGKITLAIRLGAAAIERENISKRTSAHMQQLSEKGRIVGNIPYGYREGTPIYGADGKVRYRTTEPDEKEQRAINRVKLLHLQHPALGTRRLARMMAEEGFKNRAGSPFHANLVDRILAAN